MTVICTKSSLHEGGLKLFWQLVLTLHLTWHSSNSKAFNYYLAVHEEKIRTAPLWNLQFFLLSLQGAKNSPAAHLDDLLHTNWSLHLWISPSSSAPSDLQWSPHQAGGNMFIDSDILLSHFGCLPVAMIPSPFSQPSSPLRHSYGFCLSLMRLLSFVFRHEFFQAAFSATLSVALEFEQVFYFLNEVY